jgi:hypothetical protein
MLDTVTSILGLFVQSGLMGPSVLFLSGAAVGAWFYRYMLKRNPVKLERWAAEANAVAALAKSKL